MCIWVGLCTIIQLLLFVAFALWWMKGKWESFVRRWRILLQDQPKRLQCDEETFPKTTKWKRLIFIEEINITVYSADYYRYYYMHHIVSYGNGGNELFVFLLFVTHVFHFCLENCLVTLSTLHLQYFSLWPWPQGPFGSLTLLPENHPEAGVSVPEFSRLRTYRPARLHSSGGMGLKPRYWSRPLKNRCLKLQFWP